MSATGSGGIETAIVNTLEPGDEHRLRQAATSPNAC